MQDESEGPGGSLLADMRAPTGPWIDGDEEVDGPDEVLAEAEAWTPTPIELDNARLHDPASFDIITTLVDIYGDSLFVAEYKYAPTSCTTVTFISLPNCCCFVKIAALPHLTLNISVSLVMPECNPKTAYSSIHITNIFAGVCSGAG
jgi:hypothetical protein